MKLYLQIEQRIAKMIGWLMPGRKTDRGHKVTMVLSALVLLTVVGFVVNFLEVHAGINSVKTAAYATIGGLLFAAAALRISTVVLPGTTQRLRRYMNGA